MPDDTRGWDAKQVRSYVSDAVRTNKEAWSLIPSLRVALLAQRFTAIVTGQESDTISTVKLFNLWQGMLAEAGLTDVQQ